ncbi:50S ribosomal protein L3 [Lentisphaerota bacterium ZTH]|nr:50S ribosomal protein L3 [Lentisphaerota bacterium]WET06796.1 50S ribosomal protein L3 [Lentisphaerota bacterium ZTH]
MKSIIGKKIGMTQVYDETGKVTPVTVIQAGPCVVVDVKTKDRDGYSAVQLGFGEKKAKNVSKPLLGHFKKAGIKGALPSALREFRCDSDPEVELGSSVNVEVFEADDYLDVSGTVKGRGFQGVVKRYNFGGGRYSHGGGWKRKPGSIGQCEFPGRVDKGKKMPGHMGNVRRTIQNLRVVRVMAEDNILFVKGAVPGPNGGILYLSEAIKKKNSK